MFVNNKLAVYYLVRNSAGWNKTKGGGVNKIFDFIV
jgi:hypothetical protein